MNTHFSFSSIVSLTIWCCISISICTSSPTYLSEHLKQLTDKIFNPSLKSPLIRAAPSFIHAPSASSSASQAASSAQSAKSLASAVTSPNGQPAKITKKRGVLSSFLSFPKGLRAALPLLGFRPLAHSLAGPASAVAAESMFRPSFLSPTPAHQNKPQAAVGQNRFIDFHSGGYSPHTSSQTFLMPPFLGDVSVPSPGGRPNYGPPGQQGDSAESLGLSESFISALHHQQQQEEHRQQRQGPVRQQLRFVPLHPQQQTTLHAYHLNQHQSDQHQQVHPGRPESDQEESRPAVAEQAEDAEKVMYVYVDEATGKTVATKVADMDMGPEEALPAGYNIKAVGTPLPVSDQEQAVVVQQVQQQQANQQLAEEPQSTSSPQRPVLSGFASMQEIAAGGQLPAPSPDSDGQTDPVASSYLQSPSSLRINPEAPVDDLVTDPPIGIGIPVSVNDPRAGRIIFPGRDHKPKQVLSDDSIAVPEPGVDPEVPQTDVSQDMVFMLGDYSQYMKSQSASEGADAGSAAAEFLHILTSDKPAGAAPGRRPETSAEPKKLRPPTRKQHLHAPSTGWIPISRAPADNGPDSRPVTIAILTHKESTRANERKPEEQERQERQPDSHPEQEKKESGDPIGPVAASDTLSSSSSASDIDKLETEPKVHFDDDTTSSLQDQPARVETSVTFSTSSSVSSSKDHKKKSQATGDESKSEQPAVQKRSKYNVAAVFDHDFRPIFTSKTTSLDDVREQEFLSSAPRGSYGLRIPRSSDFESEAEGSERIESSLVPSSSPHASSSSSAAFSLRSGLVASQLEESLKKPAGHFLVPVPGSDGGVKAYIVLKDDFVS